jgi:hypothetical protein
LRSEGNAISAAAILLAGKYSKILPAVENNYISYRVTLTYVQDI